MSEERRSQLVERRGVEARKWLDWLFWKLRRSANTWTFFFLWTAVVGGWGWIGGINTPLAVICQTQTSLCYRMRIRDLKSALSGVPVSKCTKTSKGMVCPPKATDETQKNSKKR